MAILTEEEFLNTVRDLIGTDSSDESIKYLEDMTDTYNDMKRRATLDSENWEKKYHELDDQWRKRYKHRFLTGSDVNNPNPRTQDDDDSNTGEDITIADLFTARKGK